MNKHSTTQERAPRKPLSYRHARTPIAAEGANAAGPASPGSHDVREVPRLRRRLYRDLLETGVEGNLQPAIDRAIGVLIVLNLIALLLEHVPRIYQAWSTVFHIFDLFSVAVFSIEYLTRLYLAPEDEEFRERRLPRLAYAASPFAMIDLIAVAPFFLQAFLPIDLRVLRFLRLLRILKLFRLLIPAWAAFKAANADRTFRQRVHAIVFPGPHGGMMHTLFDSFIAFWVVVSVVAVILESVHSIDYMLHTEFIIFDAIAVTIFSVEYCLRLYCCVEEPGYTNPIAGRWRQARRFSSVVDMLAILPFFLEALLHHLIDLRFLRIFRLLRLLKLTRYTGATNTLAKVIVREWPIMAASGFIMILLVIMTASLGYLFEHEAQPDKFENIPQSIYWAVITLASVGYGDISPVTPMGRAMTIVLALIGIGIFAIPAALLSSAFSDQLQKERDALKQELYDMLADGKISPEEEEIINREAKRLHLSEVDVQVLLDQARRERDMKDDLARLPLHKIASRPEHAVEHYKTLISEIRQLGLMTDGSAFLATARDGGRLTPQEVHLWREIQGEVQRAGGAEGEPDSDAKSSA